MPPKRKAVAISISSDVEISSKRQTRSTSKPTTKTKTVYVDSSSEDSESGVEIVEKKISPKKPVKKAAKPVKEKVVKEPKEKVIKEKVVKPKAIPKPKPSKPTPVASTSKVIDKPVIVAPPRPPKPALSAIPASTSTTPIPEKVIVKPKIKKVVTPKKPVIPLSWEKKCTNWFATFAEEEDKTKMDGSGIESLFEEMDISMEGVIPFILCYELKAPAFGSFVLADWLRAFQPKQISDSVTLKAHLLAAETSLYNENGTPSAYSQYGIDPKVTSFEAFKKFYFFIFNLVKTEGQRALDGDTAIALWTVVLVPRFPLAADFCEFGASPEAKLRGVSSDVWTQLLDFVHTIGIDLSGYSDEAAWPSILDSFVEWKQEKLKA